MSRVEISTEEMSFFCHTEYFYDRLYHGCINMSVLGSFNVSRIAYTSSHILNFTNFEIFSIASVPTELLAKCINEDEVLSSIVISLLMDHYGMMVSHQYSKCKVFSVASDFGRIPTNRAMGLKLHECFDNEPELGQFVQDRIWVMIASMMSHANYDELMEAYYGKNENL